MSPTYKVIHATKDIGTSTNVLSGAETVVTVGAPGEEVSTVEVTAVTVGGRSTGMLTVGEAETSSAPSDQNRACKAGSSGIGPFLD